MPVVAAVSLLSMLALPALAQNPPGLPWRIAVSPGAVALRWYPDELSEAQTRQTAAAHCAAIGRRAGFAALEQDGSAEIATYRCE